MAAVTTDRRLAFFTVLCYDIETPKDSLPAGSERKMKHKVQYYETDMMGVTHHSNYIRWMEEARIDLMDRMGFPYRQMEAAGVFSPVKSLQVDYLKPCTFGDEVEITAGVRAFNGVVITLAYEMHRQEELILTATSEHVFLDRNGRFVRMRRVMPEFCEAAEQQIHLTTGHP